MRRAAALCALVVLSGCVRAQDAPPRLAWPAVRVYAVLQGPEVAPILRDPAASGLFLLAELDPLTLAPVSSPVVAYLQHCPARACRIPADLPDSVALLVTCYPQNVPAERRGLHVFPAWNGKVHVYHLVTETGPGRPPRRTLFLSAGVDPALHAVFRQVGG